METLKSSTLDKEAWGPGPWLGEPDALRWRDPETGYWCLIVRSHVTGALCGYVGLAPGHACYWVEQERLGVEVHGGITFAKLCPERDAMLELRGAPGGLWWVGFDCGHFGDHSPALDGFFPPALHTLLCGEYRSLGYVMAEVKALAAQLQGLERAP